MECIVKKLRSRAGESIAEVMVALLISALGMSLLVGMIGASVRVIENSTRTMHLQYEKANAEITTTERNLPLKLKKKDERVKVGESFEIMVAEYKVKGQEHTVVFYGPYNGIAESGEGGGTG